MSDRQITGRLRFSYRGQVLTADSRNIQVNGTLASTVYRSLAPMMGVYIRAFVGIQPDIFNRHLVGLFTRAVDKENRHAE